MISILVKHLEHKAVLKQPEMQLSIVEVIAALAERLELRLQQQP
jgi:protein EFR3